MSHNLLEYDLTPTTATLVNVLTTRLTQIPTPTSHRSSLVTSIYFRWQVAHHLKVLRFTA